ncbi:GNAT family N-acetyltransferase [Methanolobus halotolerans]|uniref:N-acetyltransferase n=1 Tax=Methanolobus halotolerans TaxID=2052935 RepID=A0A4E0QRQ2_9EURY|nr:N-acetyltransferase [Methanolobus halotolerans]TGC09226.1 N-acetyltransferase [Methanolobus halotolerans]
MKIIPEHFIEKIALVPKKPIKAFELLIGILFIRNWVRIEDDSIINFNDTVADAVLNIYKDNFTVTYEDRFLKYAQYFNNITYVYSDEEAVKGYCFFFSKPLFSASRMKKMCTVYSLVVDKKYRRQGIGKSLLQKGIREMELNDIDTVTLYVEVSNESAIRLYRKIGFEIIGEVRDICSPGDRCYEMALDLSKNRPTI